MGCVTTKKKHNQDFILENPYPKLSYFSPESTVMIKFQSPKIKEAFGLQYSDDRLPVSSFITKIEKGVFLCAGGFDLVKQLFSQRVFLINMPNKCRIEKSQIPEILHGGMMYYYRGRAYIVGAATRIENDSNEA